MTVNARILTAEELSAPATLLAPSLIGKLLCRTMPDGSVKRERITETECYFGEEDTACHAHKGRTARTELLYGDCGHAYIYLCYGMHHLLNIVTGCTGHPEAVLLRGLASVSGPGRLTRALQIDRSMNGILLCPENGLWLEDDGTSLPYVSLPRVGIDYAAAEDVARPWRYLAMPH